MKLLTERAEFLVECLDLPEAAQADGAIWEPFQLAHLNDDSTFRIEEKSRQIAWSFITAAEAVANAVLYGESTAFVSINQEEAYEKIRYAKRVMEHLELPPGLRLPSLVSDNKLGLEFENGSRLVSHPSRPPRGKAGMHMVLDEFAHMQHDCEVYTAAVPVTTRGGRVRIGSSPMGAGGMFWEIATQSLGTYSGYTRVKTPWWCVRAFCKGGRLISDAEVMPTAERVERYGNERIQGIHDNLGLDAFQQEYECLYVDEAVSFFHWDLIRQNQDPGLVYWHLKDMDIAVELDNVKRAIADGKVEPVLVAGVDVGRRKNLTEIMVMGVRDKLPVRLMISLDKVKFDDQEQCIRLLCNVLPIAAVLIDETGLGMQLAENLAHDTVCEGVTFTNAFKSLWANEMKVQMERSRVTIPADRDLAYQIHSIKKKVTDAKNVTYDTDAGVKHHADKFWALALAVWAARESKKNVVEYGPVLAWVRR